MEDVNKKKPTKIILKIFRYFLLFIIFIYIIMNIFFPRRIINVFQLQHYVVKTGSMEPVINVDDVIIIINIKPEKLQPGDIMSFYLEKNAGTEIIVTHYFYDRVVDDDGKVIYRSKSNMSTGPDDWEIEEKNIIGKYIARIPEVGRIIRFIKHPIGLVMLTINIIVIYLIVNLLRKKKQ